MKIDRVIFCLNNNPVYSSFWNKYSKVWRDKYKIKPTLIYNGTHDEIKHLKLSEEYGEIILLPIVEEVSIYKRLDWSVTWSLFWGAAMFENETSMLCGIDQLMLTNFFIDHLKDVPDDKYVIGFADAYKNYTPQTLGYMFSPESDRALAKRSPASYFPSSHHVAKGALYKDVFKIEDTWQDEVKKVFSHRNKYHHTNEVTFWGLDECYSSDLIYSYEKEEVFHLPEFFYSYWHPARIDRGGQNVQYDVQKLRNGDYSEYHSHRPYEIAKPYIDKLIGDLMWDV